MRFRAVFVLASMLLAAACAGAATARSASLDAAPADVRARLLGLPPGARPLAPSAAKGPHAENLGDADGQWFASPPPQRFGGVAFYDSTADRMLLAGGDFYEQDSDVWAFGFGDTAGWTNLGPPPGATPVAFRDAITAWDARRSRMLVFGGTVGYRPSSLTFGLVTTPYLHWDLVAPAGVSPSARYGACGAVDPGRDRLVVFGGQEYAGLRNDVWSLPLAGSLAWVRDSTAGTPPAPRAGAAMVYDPVRGRLLLFGGTVSTGQYSSAPSDELWQLTFTDSLRWSRVDATGDLPGARSGAKLTWDAASGTIFLAAGYDTLHDADTIYALDPATDHWTRQASAGGPRHSYQAGQVALDARRDRLVLFGGGSVPVDEADLDTWTPLPVPAWAAVPARALPLGRFGQATVHDAKRDRLVAWGGVTFGNDIAYPAEVLTASLADPARWSTLATGGAPPPPRHEPVGVYDPRRDRAVFFGGWTYPSTYFQDTWTLSLADPPTWTRAAPLGDPPPARRAHAAVYDPARDRMIVFGGGNDSLAMNDTWALDLAPPMRWEKLATVGTPPSPRYEPGMAYDAARDRVIVVGGGADAHSKADSWALDLATLQWSPLVFEGYPLAWEHGVVSYDAARDRLLVFGGWAVDYDVIGEISGAWAIDLRTAPRWQALRAGGELPLPRVGQTQWYDARRDRLVVFAGTDFGGGGTNDRWHIDFVPGPPADAWLLDASTAPRTARVDWQCTPGAGPSVVVEREQPGVAAWGGIATVALDSVGRVHFEQGGLEPGRRYGYRLRIGEGANATSAAPVTLDIPSGDGPLVFGAWPNPARGGSANLWFSLPTRQPATLTLLDVRGRVVGRRTLAQPVTGLQSLQQAVPVPSGQYFVRVEQAGHASTTRVTILP